MCAAVAAAAAAVDAPALPPPSPAAEAAQCYLSLLLAAARVETCWTGASLLQALRWCAHARL